MNDKADRRNKMLEKVRKLLAIGRDGRGNQNEAEAAMRQANYLMAQFGIEEAEADMAAIDDMILDESVIGADGKPVGAGRVCRSCPSWAGVLAVGIGRFTDTVVSRRRTINGEAIVFQGERNDTLLAQWMFGVLVQTIQAEQKASGWTHRGEASQFRLAASAALAKRMKALAQERREMYQQAKAESGSRALQVVDTKALAVAERFGVQRTRSSRSSYSSSGAHEAGKAAGNRINIPSGRPITGGQARLTH